MIEGVYGVTVTGDPMGNTLVENVKVGDVDGDGTAEIVTGGFTYDGQKMNAQIGIWNWNGNVFALEKSSEWFINDITEVKAVTLNDVDGDERMDIVASGGTAVYGGFNAGTTPEASWLRIWSWNGETLKLKFQEDWTTGEGVFAWNVATGDIDNDGTVEIVTVGCMYISQLCDPDLRIWSVQTTSDFLTSNWHIITAIVAAVSALLVGTAYLLVRKRRREPFPEITDSQTTTINTPRAQAVSSMLGRFPSNNSTNSSKYALSNTLFVLHIFTEEIL
jgi:hypothetical protein